MPRLRRSTSSSRGTKDRAEKEVRDETAKVKSRSSSRGSSRNSSPSKHSPKDKASDRGTDKARQAELKRKSSDKTSLHVRKGAKKSTGQLQ